MPILLLFLTLAFAHNWIHGTSRAPKASQLLPAPPRAGPRQPHRQVGAGQDFVIEWVTGHPNSFYFFVVLKSSDEDKISLHTERLLNDYISKAPEGSSLWTDEKYQRMHISCTHNHQNNPAGRGDCGQGTWNPGTQYEREITPEDSFYIDRTPFAPNPGSDMAHFKYSSGNLASDRRVSYQSEEYPWIEAVHKFRINHRWPREWDAARFSLPGRQGSGEYMIHMLWRGYRDVIDIDILPEAAADIYGSSGGPAEWIKTEHCEYSNYDDKNNRCYFVQDGESIQACLNACQNRGPRGCTAVNVVPLYTPEAVGMIQGPQASAANVPWQSQGGSKHCKLGNLPANRDENTMVCYGLKPRNPTDPTFNPETEDQWYVRETDPEDPIFYSTCYRLDRKRQFEGNVACPACDGEVAVQTQDWQVGDRCLSCSDVEEERVFNEAKVWEFASVCEKCS